MGLVGLWVVAGCLLTGCLLTQEQLSTARSGAELGDDGDGGTVLGGPSVEALGIGWVAVAAGSFTMGCLEGRDEDADTVCHAQESPTHVVSLTRSYDLSATEITQDQWLAVTGEAPSTFSGCGGDCPVEGVSWYDAVAFANALSVLDDLQPCYQFAGLGVAWPDGPACEGYRLPTEAEWEYAARAGEDSLYAGGDSIEDVAWYSASSDSEPHTVAGLDPNAWDLYDMTGNVSEWTWDWYGGDSYEVSVEEDPLGPWTGSTRVRRGGSWLGAPQYARLAARNWASAGVRTDFVGLRIARTIPTD